MLKPPKHLPIHPQFQIPRNNPACVYFYCAIEFVNSKFIAHAGANA